jgi:coproporphyrinogen III oxidase-like Fe-S oxidoreductase
MISFQAFSERDLHFMNRDHSVEQGFAALDSCLLALPDATSADLIFGRPGQTVAEWVAELEFLITHYPLLGHVSLYELTLERGTQLWTDVEKGSVQMPDEDVVADMYDVAVATLDSNGLKRYEVCNFARSFDQESAHNKWYWDGGEYVGVGPGAHGRFRPKIDSHHATSQTAIDYLKSQLKSGIIASGVGNKTEFRQARVQTLDPSGWLKEVALAGHGTRRISCLSHAAAAEELLATSLRTSRGLTVERWAAVEPPCDLERLVGASDACLEFVESGTLVVDESGIRLSGEGLKLADHVVPFLMASLDDATQSMDLSIPKL